MSKQQLCPNETKRLDMSYHKLDVKYVVNLTVSRVRFDIDDQLFDVHC